MSTWSLGPVSVTRIEKQLGFATLPPARYLAGFERAVLERHFDWLVPNDYAPGRDSLVTSVHSWLIHTPHHTILFDCRAGNQKDRPWLPRFHRLDTPFLERRCAARSCRSRRLEDHHHTSLGISIMIGPRELRCEPPSL